VKRLESFCDALANYHDYGSPESEAYMLRNPGLLQDDSGKKKFSCHKAGYSALLDRVQKYCAAHRTEPVCTLMVHFGIKMKLQQERALDFMARSADTNALSLTSPLSWFEE
jgi:hypothetical protein